jgi:phosphate-selective porin OprO/OprP
MIRCRRLITSALLVVVGTLCTARPGECAGDETLSADGEAFESLSSMAAERKPAESKPDWPRTWDFGSGITLQSRGRVDTDAIWASQSDASKAIFGDLEDVVGLRRARIGFEGNLGVDRRYVAEIDLAAGDVVPRDLYLAAGNLKGTGEYQLGHFREPFSLEGGTSARHFAFMERSPINLLDPARNWGLGLYHENEDVNTAGALGVFHAGTNAADTQGGDGSTVGFTGRLTKAIVNQENGERLLHLGIALSERVPEFGVIVINEKPQSPLLELGDSSTSAFVPVIRVPASFQQLINLQFAAVRGPLWTQAEWYGSLIDQTGGGLVFFRGCHVDGGYFLTGEHRAYESGSGMLGAVHVHRPRFRHSARDDRPRGWGALELTTRFAYLDFVDPDTPLGPMGQSLGIRLPQSTFGVNWYVSDRVRMMFNYSYAVPDEINTGDSAASIFSTRLAVFW